MARGMVYRSGHGLVHCGGEPTSTGNWFSRQGCTVWLACACDKHVDDLIAARELLPRDRDALNRRRDTSEAPGSPGTAGQVSRKGHWPGVPPLSGLSSGRPRGRKATADRSSA
jgi:hypothetical protein